jgi:TPR repeat protein
MQRVLTFCLCAMLAACATPVEQACEGKQNFGTLVVLGGTTLLMDALSGPDAKAASCVLASVSPDQALDVALRLRTGIGLPKRPGVAKSIYATLVQPKGGTIYVYSPGFNGKRGTVIPVSTGPAIPGDARAMRELGKMLILGEAGKPKLKQGWRWIQAAADAGDAEAIAIMKTSAGV